MNPNLINYEIKDFPMQNEIKTEEEEPMNPQTSNTRTFKYKINNVGFLDGTSMFTFKLQKSTTAGGGDRLRVNLWNGALGAIKSAVMKVGDFEICNTQGLDRIATLRHLNVPVKQRNDLMGYYLGNSLHLAKNNTTPGTANDFGADRRVGQLRMTSSSCGNQFGQQNDGTGAAVLSMSIVADSTLNEKYGIPLYMLFPALEGRQLPLFLFQDYPVILEITFNEASKYVNNNAKTAAGEYRALDTDIVIDSPRLVVDYVLPPASKLNEFMEKVKGQGYRFEYPRIHRVLKTIPAGVANSQQEVNHVLGMEGREVHKVYQFKRYSTATDPRAAAVLGNKVLLSQKVDGQMIEEYNVEINGDEVYPDFVYNNASQYQKVAQSLKEKTFYIPRAMYFSDINSQYSQLSPQTEGLKANFKPLAVDLTNGNKDESGQDVIVGGGTPIERGANLTFKYRRTPKAAVANICLAEAPAMDVEYHVIRDGVCIIKKLPLGTSIIVSA